MEELKGYVEKIIYTNEENGHTILEVELSNDEVKRLKDNCEEYATRKFDEKKGMEIGMAKGVAKGMEKEKLATARRLLSMGCCLYRRSRYMKSSLHQE